VQARICAGGFSNCFCRPSTKPRRTGVFSLADPVRALREVRLDSTWEIPTLEVVLGSGSKRTIRGSLVFDTGAGLTQVDVGLVERLGYSVNDAIELRRVKGCRGSPPKSTCAILQPKPREARDMNSNRTNFQVSFPTPINWAFLALLFLVTGCTETIIRRTPTLIPGATITSPEVKTDGSKELTEISAELKLLQEQRVKENLKAAAFERLASARLAYLESLAEYQNIGLSILAKKDDLTEAEERVMYSALSAKATLTHSLAAVVISAADEALPFLDSDSEEHQELETLKEAFRAKLSKTTR